MKFYKKRKPQVKTLRLSFLEYVNELRGKNKTLQNDYWALEDDVRQLERDNDYSQN